MLSHLKELQVLVVSGIWEQPVPQTHQPIYELQEVEKNPLFSRFGELSNSWMDNGVTKHSVHTSHL